MKDSVLQAKFHMDVARAQEDAVSSKFNGDTDYRLCVKDVNVDGTWTCSIEWSRLQAGPPKDTKDVPDAPYVLLRGGTIMQAIVKTWDTKTEKVLLVLRVLQRV